MTKGIILIATGHPYYGNMAYNLTLSLKAAGDIPVAVVTDGVGISHLTESERKWFDHIIYPEDIPTGVSAKLNLDKYTPFDQTIFLDADMLYISQRNPLDLFNEFEGDFWMIKEGDTDNINLAYYFWASEQEIMSKYKVDWVPQTRSEVMYFKKGTKVFEKARSVKPERKLLTIRNFGENQIPDELYFNIALAQLDKRIENKPIAFWPRLENKYGVTIALLRDSYYLLSFGSNFVSTEMQKLHDNFMRATCYRLGIPFLHKIISKKRWATGRLKM